ncbi:MAG: hypothetical protein ACT4PT_03660 [Methanobacteriota archaeon]
MSLRPRRSLRPFLSLLSLLSFTSGCVSDVDTAAGDSFVTDWSERALSYGGSHDHEDRSDHRGLSTPNFEVLGFDPLVSEYYGTTAGAYMCGDAQPTPEGRRIAAVESRSKVGFALADVTLPAAPRWLGELVMQTTRIYDLAVVPDGKHVVLVTSEAEPTGLLPDDGAEGRRLKVDVSGSKTGHVPLPPSTFYLGWRTACGEQEVRIDADSAEDPLPRPASILLVDISDASEPRIVDHQPLVGYGHSVFATEIQGESLLLVTTTRPQTNELSAFEFYTISVGPRGPALELLSIYKPPPGEDAAQYTGPRGHDGWVAPHPATGVPLAYVVGHSRFTVLDVSDPRNPREIGRWTEHGPGREGISGALHSALPMPELWDGRHYTIIGPEFGGHPEGHPSGIVWVLDTTDPSDIFEVAAWTLPHEVEWTGLYMFSEHYYWTVGRTLLISMYHGGIWAVDLSEVGTRPFYSHPSVGAFLPDRDPPSPPAESRRWAPNLQEVLGFADGTMVTFDANAGLYTFRFDASRPAPAPEPWPIEAVHAAP